MDHHSLLTQDAKITRIKKLLPRSLSTGRFFIPDDAFYAIPKDDSGLRSQAKQISMWIGFKPAGLDIRFSPLIDNDGCFTVKEGKPTILIHSRYVSNPYASAALLAEYLLSYYLEHRKNIKLTDIDDRQSLVILAVVYSGLGLVALNKVTSFSREHYPRLHSLFHIRSNIGDPESRYKNLVKQFAKDYGLEISSYTKYLCPWALRNLGLKRSVSSNVANYVRLSERRCRHAYTTLVGSLLVVISGILLTNTIFNINSMALSPSLRHQKEEIDIVRSAYEACIDTVTRKQHVYSQNDFFIVRNIEADRTRCNSLSNQYNQRVERYNSELSQR